LVQTGLTRHGKRPHTDVNLKRGISAWNWGTLMKGVPEDGVDRGVKIFFFYGRCKQKRKKLDSKTPIPQLKQC
jgi:hypothetical protein